MRDNHEFVAGFFHDAKGFRGAFSAIMKTGKGDIIFFDERGARRLTAIPHGKKLKAGIGIFFMLFRETP